MMIGISDLKTKSGLETPTVQIPTPDLAVPYAAPKLQNTSAAAIPIKPKNVYMFGS